MAGDQRCEERMRESAESRLAPRESRRAVDQPEGRPVGSRPGIVPLFEHPHSWPARARNVKARIARAAVGREHEVHAPARISDREIARARSVTGDRCEHP